MKDVGAEVCDKFAEKRKDCRKGRRGVLGVERKVVK